MSRQKLLTNRGEIYSKGFSKETNHMKLYSRILREESIRLTNDSYIPEELSTPAKNTAFTKKLLGDNSLNSIGFYGEYPILSVTNGPGEGFYFVVEDDKIKYYVHYILHKFVPLHSLCQIGLWRDEDFSPVGRGDEPSLPDHVFRNSLLKRFGEVISDRVQTKLGRSFWIRQINWALVKNKYAYLLRLSGEEIGNVKEIIRIRDSEHWRNEISHLVWENSMKAERTRLLISDKPVFFPNRKEYKRLNDSIK